MVRHAACYAKLGGAYRCAREDEETRQEADEAEQIVQDEEGSNTGEDLRSGCHLEVVWLQCTSWNIYISLVVSNVNGSWLSSG